MSGPRRLWRWLSAPITLRLYLTTLVLLGAGYLSTIALVYAFIQSDRAYTKRGACVSIGDALYADTAHLHAAQAARGCPIGGTVLNSDGPPVNLPPADTDHPFPMPMTVTATATMSTTVSTTATSTRLIVVPGPTTTVMRSGPTVRVTSTRTCLPLNLNCQ